jgi:hypothetical protein
MNEQKLMREKQRGLHAAQLLDDEILISVLDAMESETVEEWKKCEGMRDADRQLRDALWLKAKCIGEFRHRLQMMVADGAIAEKRLASN